MTNFIYNMQDELFHLNMILPVGEFAPIKKLVDHIEAQGKQLRELNAAITKRDATIEKHEREKESLRKANNHLFKKVGELNQGIRNSEDLTWKQKYDALLQSSEQAIGALQKKCQEYKNAGTDATANTIAVLVKENNELKEKNKRLKETFEKLEHNYNELINQRNALVDENKKLKRANLDLGDTIGWYVEDFKKLKEENKTIEKRYNDVEKALENEKKVSKDLNVIINSKNKRLDVITSTIETLTKTNKGLEERRDELKKMCEDIMVEKNAIIKEFEEKNKKLKRDNDILRGKANKISDLAESIVMLCEDEE